EQLSVTLAVPNAAATSAAVPLHATAAAGVRVITGAVLSLVKVIVCVAVPVLLHASVTVQFFVTETLHPVTTSGCIVPVAVRPVEQLSVTLAVPNAAATSAAVPLHATAAAGVRVITGAVLSLVKVIVCVAVPVLLHASVTVQFFVTETLHPVTTSGCIVPVAVRPVEQLSVTLAVPNAAATSAAVPLHATAAAGVRVITGAVLSLVKVIVCVAVPVLLHASVTVQFFVTETLHPVTTSGCIVPVAVRPVEQLSVTLAGPNAAATSAAVPLHATAAAGVRVITGAVLSLVKVIVCVAVPVLLHASVIVQFFVTETLHPVTTSGCIVPVAVRPVEQLSVT